MIKINNDTLNLNSILNALVTSKFAYKDLVDLPEEHNSLDLLSFIKKKSTECVIYKDSNIYYLEFRGTNSFPDFVTDLQIHSSGFNDTRAHDGFVDAYNSIKEDVLKAIKEILSSDSSAIFFIVGHSLGGALANLAYYDLKYNMVNYELTNMNSVQLITFGAPKVFKRRNITSTHRSEFTSALRVTHSDDLVAHLPPDSLFLKKYEYVHLGQHLHIGVDDNKRPLTEHFLRSYINEFEKALNREVL